MLTLLLVTGTQAPDLLETFPEHKLFDRIVAENGALIYEMELWHFLGGRWEQYLKLLEQISAAHRKN